MAPQTLIVFLIGIYMSNSPIAKIPSLFKKLLREHIGVTAVEYAVIAVIMSSLAMLMIQNGDVMNAITNAINSVVDTVESSEK